MHENMTGSRMLIAKRFWLDKQILCARVPAIAILCLHVSLGHVDQRLVSTLNFRLMYLDQSRRDWETFDDKCARMSGGI